MKITGDFIVLDNVPRAKVANALVEQSRTDLGLALTAIEKAFGDIAHRVHRVREVDSAPLHVAQLLEDLTVACGTFYDAYTAAVSLFQAGQELVEDDPPREEGVPTNA